MKKIYLILLFLFIALYLLLIVPESISAACLPRLQMGCWPKEQCPDNTTCCDSSSECPALATVAPEASPPSPLNYNGCDQNSINTFLGCINISDQNELITKILRFGIGIGGGIALLIILYGSFIVMTSQGDPKRLAAGQETITSAVMGLVLLIFSIFILKIIGVDILEIPGFSTGSTVVGGPGPWH